jgi:hypothetical protein
MKIDKRRRQNPADELHRYPPPGCFAKRGCKLLKIKGECRKTRAKRLQECGSKGVSLIRRVWKGYLSSYMAEITISVYRLSSGFLDGWWGLERRSIKGNV